MAAKSGVMDFCLNPSPLQIVLENINELVFNTILSKTILENCQQVTSYFKILCTCSRMKHLTTTMILKKVYFFKPQGEKTMSTKRK